MYAASATYARTRSNHVAVSGFRLQYELRNAIKAPFLLF